MDKVYVATNPVAPGIERITLNTECGCGKECGTRYRELVGAELVAHRSGVDVVGNPLEAFLIRNHPEFNDDYIITDQWMETLTGVSAEEVESKWVYVNNILDLASRAFDTGDTSKLVGLLEFEDEEEAFAAAFEAAREVNNL